jgi:hypothetical protein
VLNVKREIMITGVFPSGGEIRLTTAVHGKRLYIVEWRATDNEEWTLSYMGGSFTVAFKMYRRMTNSAMSDSITFNKKA